VVHRATDFSSPAEYRSSDVFEPFRLYNLLVPLAPDGSGVEYRLETHLAEMELAVRAPRWAGPASARVTTVTSPR
jgi:hypothetical protein